MWITLLAGSAESAAQLGVPVLAGGMESGSVETYDEDGELRWSSRWTMAAETDAEGRPIVRMREEGEGLYSGFDEEVVWRTDSLWSAGDTFAPIRTERTVRNLGGTVLVRERTDFDRANGVIRFEREEPETGDTQSETFDLPRDVLSVEGIAAALRGIPFGEDVSVETRLFTPEPELYEVTLHVRGRETVGIAEGDREAYKVEIEPHLGLLSVFRFLLPEAYFWFAVEPPHDWLRYEGPEAGRGTPAITMEAAP
jgi:hypothetical protein